MKSKRIAMFGCSWTQGLEPHNYDNWVKYFSEMYPDCSFFNYAAAGTSIVYHTHLLEQVTAKQKFDLVIFQITSPARFTWWKPHKINKMLYKQTPNLWAIESGYGKYVDRINTGTITSKKFIGQDKKKHKFGVEYYSRLTNEQILLDHKAYINYIKDKVDFHFYHRSAYVDDAPSVYDTLGESNFNKFVIDSGDHFSKEGNQWQAKWIDLNLKNKGLI